MPESSAIGQYKRVRPPGGEILILKGDYSYTRQWQDQPNEQKGIEKGRWKYEILGGNSVYIRLYSVDPASDVVIVKPLENWFGTLYLGSNEEGSSLYKKIE